MSETLQKMISDGERIANLFEALTEGDKNIVLVYMSALRDKELADMDRDEKAGQEAEMRKLFKKKDLGNDSFDLLGWVMNRFPNLPLYISLIALAISIVMALAKK